MHKKRHGAPASPNQRSGRATRATIVERWATMSGTVRTPGGGAGAEALAADLA